MKTIKMEGAHINLPIQVPRWANYVAQDANGKWWVFENKPAVHHGEWRPNGGDVDLIADEFAYDYDNPAPDWNISLRQIVKE